MMITFPSSFDNSLLYLFTFLLLLPITNSAYFNFLQFSPDAISISYQGDASASAGAIAFNRIDYINRVGWATYAQKVRIWDSSTGKTSDFTTKFSFIIDTEGADTYGHGLSFFLAPVGSQIPPNSAGGFLGLLNTTTAGSSHSQIIFVEFDTYPNVVEGWDPSVQHVGININSMSSAKYTPWNASFHSGDVADATIAYNSTTKNLSAFWNYRATTDPKENSSISHIVDLKRVLPEYATIGFSAATGMYVEWHSLKSWEFSSNLDGNAKGSRKTAITVIIAVSSGVLMAGLIPSLLLLWSRKRIVRRKKEGATNATSINEDIERKAGPKRFSYQDLVSATNHFSDDRKLGVGGFGAVYKGYLRKTDTAVAVKKIKRGSKQGRKEYVTEVKTISQLRHRNLVQLLGWCHEKGEFLLVYEFMPNGSLDANLFCKKTRLNWAMRYKISLGLASALLYLHEEWEQCVVHRDIKSSNVMLDSGFNAKLGDFGLARLMDHELGPQTTGLAGTLGYMAPEYISTRRASKESDVYSFGVVSLEIATGRKVHDHIEEEPETSLVQWIWNLYGCGKLHLGLDKRLQSDFDEKQVECLMIVGLWCVHPDPNMRPSIRQAIQVLNFEAAIPNLPSKMAVPVYHAPSSPAVSLGGDSITHSSIEVGR